MKEMHDSIWIKTQFDVFPCEVLDHTNAWLKCIDFRALKLNGYECVTSIIIVTFHIWYHLFSALSSKHKPLIPLNSLLFTCKFLVLGLNSTHIDPKPTV